MAVILVVDDEVPIGDLLEMVLTDAGHQVLLATNGRLALEHLASAPVDLIISDLMMPVMDGAELLRRLRAEPVSRAIPLILMCSLPEAAVAERVQGHDGFMQKPFRIAPLAALVDRLLLQDGSGSLRASGPKDEV